jgi:hypothetical protein
MILKLLILYGIKKLSKITLNKLFMKDNNVKKLILFKFNFFKKHNSFTYRGQ